MMKQPPAIALVLLFMLACVPMLAQSDTGDAVHPKDDPAHWIHVQDSLYIYRFTGGDTVEDRKVSACYNFNMTYGPDIRINYLFTEPAINSRIVPLLHWKYRRVVNAGPGYLNFNSRTANFAVRTGDTVSFFKEFNWTNPVTGRQDPDNYRSLDTLLYSVWLVRASDSQCVAQLDSMAIMPSPEAGVPLIYGTHPILATVPYVVPSTIGNDSMFIGVCAVALGNGDYNFSRRDGYTIALSDRLVDPYWINYLRIYSSVIAKRAPGDLTAAEGAGDEAAALQVMSSTAARSEIMIAMRNPGSANCVAIYDEAGRIIAYPITASSSRGDRTTSFRFPSGGTYFVALREGERIVTTKKVIITQ